MAQVRLPAVHSWRVLSRFLHASSALSAANIAEEFEHAKTRLNSLKEDPGNQTKLELYALFKQATVGMCTGKRPGMTDFVGRAKWDAWNALGEASKEEAQRKYIDVINGLAGAAPAAAEPTSQSSVDGNILSTVRDKMHIITLNRPTKKNALLTDMYGEISAALARAAKDDSTVAVLTGAGDFYSSGNDLSNFLNIKPADFPQMAERTSVILKNFVASFIDFPKPLIAVVNGPAVGITVTVLGMFDAVYATDRATFHTPFSSLGQSPEGCSSLTFPQIMGHSAACEMLLFNRKLSAAEAKDRGLVTEVFPNATFQKDAWERVGALASLPPGALRASKGVMRHSNATQLHDANKRECEVLVGRWLSDECMSAVTSFFKRKA